MSSVTVITASIGRDTLKQTIESVAQQTVSCRHFVFLNGADKPNPLISLPYDAEVIRIPETTGDCGSGPGAGAIYAAAPWLTNSDYVCYLNDDDWFEPEHVATLLALAEEYRLHWAYSLRRFVNLQGDIIGEDNFDSLGHYPCLYDPADFLVDNSCFLVRTSLARKYGHEWHTPRFSDRNFLRALKGHGVPYGTTGLSTVNYRIGLSSTTDPVKYVAYNNEAAAAKYPDGFPWRKEQTWNT